MAEVIGIIASIIAVVQIADRVVGLCKDYLETVHDAPSELRAMLIETSTTKIILENVVFLYSCNNEHSTMFDGLAGSNGPIEGCRDVIAKMEALFPSEFINPNNRSKRQKVKDSWTRLAWPTKQDKAKKLVEDLSRFKATISFALTTSST
jgi:hypothetical protein